MSELSTNTGTRDYRWQLLATASIAGLIGAGLPQMAIAETAEQPTVWIELGGQLEGVSGTGDRFIRPFMSVTPTPSPFVGDGSPISAQRPARYAKGGELELSYHPEASDWTFSLGLRYGRSNSKRYIHQQTAITTDVPKYLTIPKFAENITKQSESHAVLDFHAGREVGIGLFGRHSTSTISGGIRFAQFSSSAMASVYARPQGTFYHGTVIPSLPIKKFQEYTLHGMADRSFRGVGPSLSWDSSVSLTGDNQSGELFFDWGVNGAILFGRQKARVNHETLHQAFSQKYQYRTIYHYGPGEQVRAHSVVAPNLGAQVAATYRAENFKATLGYRADFFFGAMDAGIDQRRSTITSFHGPFAVIAIGLGG